MEILPSKQVFTFLWCVYFFLLFPVFLAIHVTSSSIHIDSRHIDDNDDMPEMYNLKNGYNIGRANDVTDNSTGDKFSTNTASGKFLESLREKCKKHKSITLICNSLRLVLPIILPSEPISASDETNTNSPLEHIKLKKQLTRPSDLIDTETYIVRPETYEATTTIPMNNRYFHLQNNKRSSVTTNRDNAYDITDPNGPYAPDHILPNMDDNTYMKPGMFYKAANHNHMVTNNFEANVFRKNDNSDGYSHVKESDIEEKYGSDKPDVAHNITYEIQFVTENVLRKSDRSEQNAYPEFTESDVQGINNAIPYRNNIMTGDSEEDAFRTMDRSEQNAYPEFTGSDVQGINNARKPDKSSNIAYQNHMTGDSEEDVFRKMDRSEQNAYPEFTESDVQGINNARKPDKSRNIAYQNHIMTGDSEEDVFRKMDRSEQTAYSDHMETNGFTTPYTDINPDYDEMKGREKDGDEMEDEDTTNYSHEDEGEMACSDEATCSGAKNSAENVSHKAGGEEDGGEIGNTMDRFIDDSVKTFKNSFTIKFPTFERITNKISEWLQFVFGRETRDEARGKLKKTLQPIILGLLVKGVIVLASVTGLIVKVIAAKAVLLGLITVIFTAVAIFKKYSAPQGGTIYVHTNGGSNHKNGGSWDKEGYGPHPVAKDAIGYQAWENYGRRQRGDYSTPAPTGDRYYQHYNSYYRPNSAAYSTSVSPYGA